MATLGISLGFPSPKLLHKHSHSAHPQALSSSLPLSTNTISLPTISRPTRTLNRSTIMASADSAVEVEKQGIKIVNKPSESQLSQLGVRSWPKWGCPPSKFPWTYSSKETCYLLEGKVKVYPDGSNEAVEIGAGDLVVFPKGMSCTWDVSEAVDKHYKFE